MYIIYKFLFLILIIVIILKKKYRKENFNDFDGVKGPTGPKGFKGPMGSVGFIGPPGQIGKQGSKGFIGPPGEKGIPGDIGNYGDKGVNGARGEKGLKGYVGNIGKNGIPGPIGPPGPKGESGKPGNPGIKGNDGAIGESGFPSSVLGVPTQEGCVWKKVDFNDQESGDCGEGSLMAGIKSTYERVTNYNAKKYGVNHTGWDCSSGGETEPGKSLCLEGVCIHPARCKGCSCGHTTHSVEWRCCEAEPNASEGHIREYWVKCCNLKVPLEVNQAKLDKKFNDQKDWVMDDEINKLPKPRI
jgi:hypothetical protein